MEIYNAISVLRKEYDFPVSIEMNLIDTSTNESVPVQLNPIDIICITTSSSNKFGKGRRKALFLAQWQFNPGNTSLNLYVKEYTVNNDELTFQGLIEKLDILNKVLVQISKSAIVNLGYYQLHNNSTVQLILNDAPQKINSFKVSEAMSGEFSFLDKYLIYRVEFLKRVLLQKLALGYMESNQQ